MQDELTNAVNAKLVCTFTNWCGRQAAVYSVLGRLDSNDIYFKVIDGGPIETFYQEDLPEVKRNNGRTYGFNPNTDTAMALYGLAERDAFNPD